MSELERIPGAHLIGKAANRDSDCPPSQPFRGSTEGGGETGTPRQKPPLPEDVRNAITGATALEALVVSVQADLRGSRRLQLPPPDVPSPDDARAVLDAMQNLAVPEASRWLAAAPAASRLALGTDEVHRLPQAESASRIGLSPAEVSTPPFGEWEGSSPEAIHKAEQRRRIGLTWRSQEGRERSKPSAPPPQPVEPPAAAPRSGQNRPQAAEPPTEILPPIATPDAPTLLPAAIPGGWEYSTGAGVVRGILVEQPHKQE